VILSIQMFGRLRELVAPVVEMAFPDGGSAAAVLVAVGEKWPVVSALLGSVRVAVNHEFVTAEQVIVDGDEVALIPPVSGGA